MTREEAEAYGKDYYRDLITACCEIDEKHKEFVRMSLEALEQEPCEDEYIKVPKKALKYRTAGMVVYNADIERAVICGAQESC